MDYSYPLLHKVFNHFNDNKHDVKEIYLVCCQHFLEPQFKMFELFVDFGFDPNKIIVLGKAYSTNDSVLKDVKGLGIKAFQPNFTGASFDIEHKNNCENLLKLIPEKVGIILLDDGAELIKTFKEAHRNVIFAVEQTSSGFRKLENDLHSFPIVNVARSATKLNHESPFIARQGFERIKDYFLKEGINNPSILVVGLGPIGIATSEIFEQNKFLVYGFDINKGHTDLVKSIIEKQPDVIIGATGSNILTPDDTEKIVTNKPLYLVSISSSDREFPVSYFRQGNEIHSDVVYKNITFLNNGFPITFKGNRYENTPFEMEKTICLLFGSVLDGVVNGIQKTGLVDVSESLEKLINQ